MRWQTIEQEKRRLIAHLLLSQLPIPDRQQNPDNGLAFDLLGADSNNNAPITGHARGGITLNILEADDDYRAQMRTNMSDHYRTLLGHFRHEVGHFYWDILIRDSQWLASFRQVFGDERADYQAALNRHYQQGAPIHWQQQYISAYASMHPWEDWAETWAHYLHMMDALNIATGFGMQLSERRFGLVPFECYALYAPQDPEADDFIQLINHWIELVAMLNALARSIGQLDVYPFVLSTNVVAKLQYVHLVVRDHGHPPLLKTISTNPCETSHDN